MLTVHLGARVPADLATALAIMASERGSTLSQECREAVTRHVREWAARNDDEAADTAPVATITPAGRGPGHEPA